MFINLFTSPKVIRIDGEYAIHLCPICGFEQVETKIYDGTIDLDIVENEKVKSPNICQNCQDEHPDTIWCNICRRFNFSGLPCECYKTK